MGSLIWKTFKILYKKNKQTFLYILFGGLTFIVSISSYYIFSDIVKMNELVSNIFSWIIAVLFAFFTNKIWVFSVPTNSTREFAWQILSFFCGRIITLIVEEFILFIFIICLQFPSLTIKIIAQIIVIIANYIISKLIIFNREFRNL